MHKHLYGLCLSLAFFVLPLSPAAQEAAVDTTTQGYQIGYKIGSWLPFIIIFTLALMVIIRSYRLSRKDNSTSNGPLDH
jgi:hypothetical protein